MSPALPSPRARHPPRLGVLSPHLPAPGRSGAPGPIAPKRLSRSPISGRGRGSEAGLDSSLRLRSVGAKAADVAVRNGGPLHPKGISGPKKEKMRKRLRRVLQGARPQTPSPRMLFPGPRGAKPRVQPAPPPRFSAVPTRRFQSPENRPSAAHDDPHLQMETPGGGGVERKPHARTLAPTDMGSSSLPAHRACARTGVPPRPAPSPANPHSRRHACALAAQRPNHPFSKLRDPPFATKGHWHPIRIEVVVGGSRKSNSQ